MEGVPSPDDPHGGPASGAGHQEVRGVAGAALVVHMVGIRLAFRGLGQPLPSNVPVNPGARAGRLAFQLPLGGPSEELLDHGARGARLRGPRAALGLRLEAVVAAATFSLAHAAVVLGTWQVSARDSRAGETITRRNRD